MTLRPNDYFRHDRHLWQIEAYWRSLLQDELPPLRSAVLPKDIEDSLEYAFIGEAVTPACLRLRVAGSHLNDLVATGASGLPLASFFEVGDRDAVAKATQQLFKQSRIVRITCKSDGGAGRDAMTGQILLLPLRSDLGDVTRALGCFVTLGRIGGATRKFRAIDIQTRSFNQLPPIPRKRMAGLSEDPTPFFGKPKRHLRLVVSND